MSAAKGEKRKRSERKRARRKGQEPRRRLVRALVCAVVVALVADAFGLAPSTSDVAGLLETAREAIFEQDATEASGSGTQWSEWDATTAPDYWLLLGTAQTDTSVEPGTATYSELDDLGRAGRVCACVTYDMMVEGSERERADMSDLEPSGWGHNAEVTIENPSGVVYSGWFYNRSHLLAKSLGGEEVIENVVTATRCQNVGDNAGDAGGAAYVEGVARSWLEENPDGHVWYTATPVYDGDDLVCRSVIYDVLSSDASIDMRVEVFNVAPGYQIDYATGEWTAAENGSS